MDTRFDVGQISELRRIEDARVRQGQSGLRDEFSALISRLTSGGVGTPTPRKKRGKGPKLPDRDLRIFTQAKVLWDKGWATKILGEDEQPQYQTFFEYLATIPDLPTFPDTYDARFPHLVLVDRRPTIVEACRLLNVKFKGNNDTLVPHDPEKVPISPVSWMRCQDGKIHRNRKPNDCRTEFSSRGDELGLDALEGLALHAQYPYLLEVETAMDLPASVHADSRDSCACLRRWADDGVELGWQRASGLRLRLPRE